MNQTGILGVKNWRRQRGISLEAIAASTKLSVRHLEAIESGEFSKLPGGIYNTSYIRQYARAIDFDEAELLAAYQDFCNPPGAAAQGEERQPSRVSRLLFQHY
ncbi:MAG TPA: helix-turn-helix domain-containing protein [Bryobacteraceae bacterium]|jgi:cytoskeletal protein RodZ|nr:helix-turn-helix domain-containing protein [Bryobacteraceae bacterium]